MRQNSISRSHSEAPAHAGRVLQGGGRVRRADGVDPRSEEHTSELQSQSNLVCRLLLEKKNRISTSGKESRHFVLKTGIESSSCSKFRIQVCFSSITKRMFLDTCRVSELGDSPTQQFSS